MQTKKQRGFHKKLTLAVTLIISIVFTLVAVVSYFIFRDTLDTRINKEISATLAAKALEFDSWIDRQENTIAYFGDSIQYNNSLENMTYSELEDFLASRKSADTVDSYVVIPNKTTLFASKFVLPEDFNVTQRDWYKATIAANGAYTCTSPYIDNNTQKLVMTVSRAFYKSDKTLDFVIGTDIYADYLTEITNSIQILDNAYPMLADDKFGLIVHGSEEYMPRISEDGSTVITSLSDIPAYGGLVEAISNENYSPLKTKDYNGKTSYFVPAKIGSTGWYYLYSTPSSQYNSQMWGVIMAMFIMFVISAIISIVILSILIRKIIKPIDELKEAAADMKEGDLSYTPTYYADDSISDLCISIAETNQVWTGYINDINSNLDKLSHGDFNIEFNGNYVGDFAKIKESVIRISDKLSDIIGGIDVASNEVALSSASVASSSSTLAEGVSEQSKTIDELMGLIEKMVTQINENAASAESAQAQSGITSDNVVECNRRMTELLQSMNDINNKAQEIVKIVKTIDDIAFQTNILALNAAIEAARAGNAGKGFAVVADEVRNLASKSAEAVKNTNELISGTGEVVEKGSRLAAETEAALVTVSEGVGSVNDLIVKISEASEAQAADVKNVSEKITAIEDIVRSTAASAQESAASSDKLNTQSQNLQDILTNFVGH